MEITEVRVKLVNVKNDKLRAFCSITIDNDFVIRDLKVIEGAKGAFVAMPSRKLTEKCSRCGGKNHYRARFCNDCGARLGGDRSGRFETGNQKRHTDIAHPINSKCREVIQKKVLEVYQEELDRSVEPDYKPMEYDVFDEEALFDETSEVLQGDLTPEQSLPEGEMAPEDEEELYLEKEGHDAAHSTPITSAGRMSGRDRPSRGQDMERRSRSEQDRGRFRRGGRRSRSGRVDQKRGNGGGQRRNRNSHETLRGGDALGIPEGDRDKFLPDQQAAPAASQASSGPQNPIKPKEEPDTEPEDNFGAGLFP